jgi:2-oxoglutarate/2-oxoacid ferredoxin oxidoreductase subunit alpha
MRRELNIRITGEAGQGMKTIGTVLSKMFKDSQYYVFSHVDYMSRIRGGNNYIQITAATHPVYCPRKNIDLLIPLTKDALEIHKESVGSDGIVIVDKNEFELDDCEDYLCANFYELANKAGGSDLYINSVSVGVISCLTGLDPAIGKKIVASIFSDKGKKIVNRNLKAVDLGYEKISEKFKSERFKLPTHKKSPEYLMDGKEAVALGAIAAGCKFYTAYPMSPSTGVMNTIAHYSEKFGIVVEQAEDEIAAVNMAIGASATGTRSMTSTSGGGFALMGEGISLAGMTETPLVVGNFQRPGPATGFPTRTEQGDLNLVLGSGHGEFAKVVLAPGSIEESFCLTEKAFNLADKYQIPVIILSDQYLADSVRNIDKFDLEKEPVQSGILSDKEAGKIKNYRRYELTSSGISPRAIFSQTDDPIYLDSDEHTEEGHITEDADVRKAMVDKRFSKKLKLLREEFIAPTVYNIENAGTLFFCFGSVLAPLLESLKRINKPGLGMVHLSQVYPLDSKKLAKLTNKAKNIFTVENNAEGQLAKLLQREAGITPKSSILKYDGRPYILEELIQLIEEISTDNPAQEE